VGIEPGSPNCKAGALSVWPRVHVIGDVSLTSMCLNSILKSFPGWHHLEVSPCQPCFFVKAVIFASYLCFLFLRSSQTLFPSQAFSILKADILCFLCPLWFPYSEEILFPYCIFSFIKTARICFPKPASVSLEWPNFVSFTSFWFPQSDQNFFPTRSIVFLKRPIIVS